VGSDQPIPEDGPPLDDVDGGAEPEEHFEVAVPDDASELLAEVVAADLAADLTSVVAERDEYLEALLRVKAEFDNSRKRWTRERDELVGKASANLANHLLPVLDACEAALGQGSTEVEPIARTLLEILEKEGLERMAAEGEPFDPHLHEAVMHEPGDDGEPVVAEILRTGYAWKGVVLRPAMVRVRG